MDLSSKYVACFPCYIKVFLLEKKVVEFLLTTAFC